jgi:hypothetical protein
VPLLLAALSYHEPSETSESMVEGALIQGRRIMTDARSRVHVPNYCHIAIRIRWLVLAGLLTFVAYESFALPHCWTEDEYLTSDDGIQLTTDDGRTLLTTGRNIQGCEPMRNGIARLILRMIP